MKKKFRVLLLGLACLFGLTVTSCDPTNEPDPQPQPQPDNQGFVGVYDLTIITDSLGTDGEWFETSFYEMATGKQEPPRYGTLTIEETEVENRYHITSEVSKDGVNDLQPYYITDGYIDDNGDLVLENSTTVQSSGALNFEYAPIHLDNEMTFRTEMHTYFGSLDCGYIFTNTIKKRL